MNSSKVTQTIKKVNRLMELGEFQILVPNRQRTDMHTTAETLPTALRSPALRKSAPHIHLHGQHIGNT